MAELHYFPLMAADWLAGEAVSMMTPEQEGAFIHLLCYAWQSSGVPCSLPNDDATLAHLSRLGRRWKKVGPFVKAQFDVMEDDPTRLRNSKLWAVFSDSSVKHERRVRAGKVGGIAKAERKQSASNATAMLEHSPSKLASNALAKASNQNQNQRKEELPSPQTDAAVRTTWITPYGDAWKERCGGDMHVGPALPSFAKLRREHGDEETLRRWKIYLAETPPHVVSVPRFASTFGQWSGQPIEAKARPARVLAATEM